MDTDKPGSPPPSPTGAHSVGVGPESYREDALYPRLTKAVEVLLQRGNVVTPVDVLVAMGMLTREQLEDWRHGRVPFLERAIKGNLTRLSRLLRILRFHAHELDLKPSWTAYVRRGRGPRHPLRFTKTGERSLEEAYATHFVRRQKGAPPSRVSP